MIVVDSSVWIDHFNGAINPSTQLLRGLSESDILVGDLVMAEVLQGFRRQTDFYATQEILSAFELRSMVGFEIAVEAARNYRSLRERGATPRNTIDTLIATFCIVNDHELLHSDRDFDLFEKHLALRVLRAS